MLTDLTTKLATYAERDDANSEYLSFVREEIALLSAPEQAQGRLHTLHGRGRPHLWRVATALDILPEVQQLTQTYIDHVLDSWIEHIANPGDDPYFAGDMTALGLLLPKQAHVSAADYAGTSAASRAAVRLAADPARRARVREGFLGNFTRRYLATELLPDEVAAGREKVRELRVAKGPGELIAQLTPAGWGNSGELTAFDPSSVTRHSPAVPPVKDALRQLGIYGQAWEAWRGRLASALVLWEGNSPAAIARRMSLEQERVTVGGRFRQNWLTNLVQEAAAEGSLSRATVRQARAVLQLEELPQPSTPKCGRVAVWRATVELPAGLTTWYVLTETHFGKGLKNGIPPRSFVFTDLTQAEAYYQVLEAALEPEPIEA